MADQKKGNCSSGDCCVSNHFRMHATGRDGKKPLCGAKRWRCLSEDYPGKPVTCKRCRVELEQEKR